MRFFRSKILMFFLFIFLFEVPVNIHGFGTISDAQSYTKRLEEYPSMDNKNLLMPNYTSFYKSQKPGFWSGVGSWFLRKKKVWSSEVFESLLQKVVDARELCSYTDDFILKMNPRKGSQFIIWGDLYGAFHSLIRDLIFLERMEIIDNNFKIIKPNHYFIFNGDFIGKSPFSMEVLTIVLKLLDVNPDKVFYIKGRGESEGNWRESGLKTELQISNELLSKDKSFIRLIDRFFNTLPLAVYLMRQTRSGMNAVRISNFDRSYHKLEESYFMNFLLQENKDTADFFKFKQQEKSYGYVGIKAIIESKDKSTVYQKTDGLSLLSPDKGATAWSILSGPTRISRSLFDFHNDAFAILSVFENIDDWTISLYKRDVRVKGDFQAKKYNLVSGEFLEDIVRMDLLSIYRNQIFAYEQSIKEAKEKLSLLAEKEIVGIEEESEAISMKGILEHFEAKDINREKEIVFGCTGDLSSMYSYLTKYYLKGIYIALERENKAGGVHGKKVRIEFANDERKPEITRKKMEYFLNERKIDIFVSSFSSPTIEPLIPEIRDGRYYIIFPETGSPRLRDSELKGIIHLKASFLDEAFSLIKYARRVLGKRRMAVVFPKEDFDENDIEMMPMLFGLDDVCAATFPGDSLDIYDAVKKIKEFNPDSIMLMCIEPVVEELVKRLGVDYLSKRALLGISLMNEARPFLLSKGLRVIMTYVVPPHFGSDYLEIVREYLADSARQGLKLSPLALTGYIQTRILFEILRRISGEITKESIMNECEKVKDVLFKGLHLNFDPEARTLAKDLWIDDYKGYPIQSRIID
jgi:branched-chain amino acid transport system substrate-binding protein